MIKFNGAEIFDIEELNENARIETEKEKLINQGFIDVKELVWTKQKLEEWDGTISNVEVAEIWNEVLVKYEDGTIYREEKGRFKAGKWAESYLTEAFKDAMEKFNKETKKIIKVNNKEYFKIFRNGDITRVTREELIIKEVVMVSAEYEYIMMGELENGEIIDICRFYPDEIWISEYELKGKTLEEALDVKYQKDRAYLGQWR